MCIMLVSHITSYEHLLKDSWNYFILKITQAKPKPKWYDKMYSESTVYILINISLIVLIILNVDVHVKTNTVGGFPYLLWF